MVHVMAEIIATTVRIIGEITATMDQKVDSIKQFKHVCNHLAHHKLVFVKMTLFATHQFNAINNAPTMIKSATNNVEPQLKIAQYSKDYKSAN